MDNNRCRQCLQQSCSFFFWVMLKKKHLQSNFVLIFICWYQSLLKDQSVLLMETLVAPPTASPLPRGGFSRRALCRLFRLQAWSPAVTCDPLAAQRASVMLLLESRRRLHSGHVVILPKFNKRSEHCVGPCLQEGENIPICWKKSYLVNTFALLKLDSKCFV